MFHRINFIAATLFTLFLPASFVFSNTIKQDDFNSDTSADYKVFSFNGARDGVEFNFDYGALGIPEAPNSTAGGATGLRFFANNPADGVAAGTSAVQMIPSSVGSRLAGIDYRMTYDVWMNVNGPLPSGGTGSTEAFMAGVGWNGSDAIEIGLLNGTYFTITGEGGSGSDVRVFTPAGFNPDGVLAASANSDDPYYAAIFPGGVNVGELPVQGGQAGQTGTTIGGQMAFQWHEVRLDVMGDTVNFFVDDLLISTVANTDREGNVMIGYGDYFASVTDAPQWSFGLVDNLQITVIPEPTAIGLFSSGCLAMLLRRRRR